MTDDLVVEIITLPTQPDVGRLNVKCSQCDNPTVYAYIDSEGEVLLPTWCNVCQKKERLKQKLTKIIELYWDNTSTEQIEKAMQEFESAITRY